MQSGNYSSAITPPGGGGRNYFKIQLKYDQNDSKQSGIYAVWQI